MSDIRTLIRKWCSRRKCRAEFETQLKPERTGGGQALAQNPSDIKFELSFVCRRDL